MSAVVAMVRPDGVLLVADRRTVLGPRVNGEPGTAPIGEDAAKLGATSGGCVWAMAGQAGVGDLDLRSVVSNNRAANPAVAAQEVRSEFERFAKQVRAGAWDDSGFAVPEAFDRAHTVALIAGLVGGAPELRMVGLMVNGPATEVVLGRGAIKVLAPPPLCERLPATLERLLIGTNLDAAAEAVADSVRDAARSMPDLVSSDFDVVKLRRNTSSPEVTHLVEAPNDQPRWV